LWQYSPISIDKGDQGCTYAFGFDYAWGMSTGRLAFANAVKMKMSVIFGIFHMNLGILVKGTNAIFRGNIPILIFEVIGGLIILNGLFGWMDLLVFNKWTHTINLFGYENIKDAANGSVGVIYQATDIIGKSFFINTLATDPSKPVTTPPTLCTAASTSTACYVPAGASVPGLKGAPTGYSKFYSGNEISTLCPLWYGSEITLTAPTVE